MVKMEHKYTKKPVDNQPATQAEENGLDDVAAPVSRVIEMQRTLGNQQTIRRLATVQRVPDGLPDLATQQARQEEKAEKERKKAEYDKAVATPLTSLDNLITLVQHV
jgi:hypothetical protein